MHVPGQVPLQFKPGICFGILEFQGMFPDMLPRDIREFLRPSEDSEGKTPISEGSEGKTPISEGSEGCEG